MPLDPSQDSVQSSKDKIVKAASTVSLATLISRILGFLRDMIIADLIGAKAAADAFFVAFRIPSLLRRLTAEGALTSAFVPVFTETATRKGKAQAFALACNIATILVAILIAVSLVCEIFAPWVVRAVAPGFTSDEQTFELTTLLLRIMFPYIILISIASVLMGMLNSMGRFFVPASAPAFLNIAIISSVLLLGDMFEEPTIALAIGVIIGGFLQVAVQLFPLFSLGWRYIFSFNLKDPQTRKVGLLMVPAIFGMAVAEVNALVDTILASLLPEGSVSYLYYGNRITQFPLGVFGVAIGIAALPSMSNEVARGVTGKLTELLSHSLRLTLFIAIPSTVGLLVLAGPITNVLFERGAFTETARNGAVWALWFYAIGLFAFSGVKVIVSAFYSLQDTATPTKVAAWCMALNIALNLALMGPLQHGGLALATSIASMVNMFPLLWFFKKKIGDTDGYNIISSSFKAFLAAIIMGAGVAFYSHTFFSYDASIGVRVFHVTVAVFGGSFLYYLSALAFGSREAKTAKDRFLKKIGIGS